MKKILSLFLILFILVFGYLFLSYFINITVDCSAYHFDFFYDLKSGDLKRDLNSMIEDNTNVLENCIVTNYVEINGIPKYSVKAYNVSFSCDILNFSWIVYAKGNKVYELTPSMGPCGQDNVYFNDTKKVDDTLAYSYDYEDLYIPDESYKRYPNSSLESDIIQHNQENFDFCIEVGKRMVGKDNIYMSFEGVQDGCLFTQAEKIRWDNQDQSIELCAKIKHTATMGKCYSEVVDALMISTGDRNKATDFCNRLNQSIPADYEFYNPANDCFYTIDHA